MKIHRKILNTSIVLALALTAFSGCDAKGPSSISLEKSEYMLSGIGSTYDIKNDVSADGGGDFSYKSSDSSVAEVSENGIVEAKGFGSAEIRVELAQNKDVFAAMEIFVYPYLGVYTAEKYIDAMGCDIRIRMTLNEDGTYEYYRYPMNVALSGGGEMPGLSDKGAYAIESNEFKFTGEFLGEFPLEFQVSGGEAYLQGKIPTGGAATQMQLMLNSTEDKSESGTYFGLGETSEGSPLEYELTIDKGGYSLKNTADGEMISEGTYTFENDLMEFSGKNGVSFNANFDSERDVIEGTGIPAGDQASERVSMTLKKA